MAGDEADVVRLGRGTGVLLVTDKRLAGLLQGVAARVKGRPEGGVAWAKMKACSISRPTLASSWPDTAASWAPRS